MKKRFHAVLLMMLAGWINRQQQEMIEYLMEENKILREQLGKKRLLLNDEQRRRLAVLAKKLGKKALTEICGIFSPDTLIGWHQRLVACKYAVGVVKTRHSRVAIREISFPLCGIFCQNTQIVAICIHPVPLPSGCFIQHASLTERIDRF